MSRAINAQPWEPTPGMVKRQCPDCGCHLAPPPDAAEPHFGGLPAQRTRRGRGVLGIRVIGHSGFQPAMVRVLAPCVLLVMPGNRRRSSTAAANLPRCAKTARIALVAAGIEMQIVHLYREELNIFGSPTGEGRAGAGGRASAGRAPGVYLAAHRGHSLLAAAADARAFPVRSVGLPPRPFRGHAQEAGSRTLEGPIYRVMTRRLASSAVREPVASAEMSCWKRRMAARVSGPKIPSTGPW
jgi:hypothetical protein